MAAWRSLGVLVVFLAAGGWALGQNRDLQEPGPMADPAPSLQRAPALPDQPVMPQDPRLEPRAPDGRDAQGQMPGGQATGPQNLGPQGTVPPNAGPPQPPPPPFVLTPAEQAQLDRLLLFWEKSSQNIKTFRCNFTRWEYDPVFGPPEKPLFRDQGELRYAAPDKGLYSVDGTRAEKWISDEGGQGRSGRWAASEGRAEKWICDGKSIFEYDFQRKRVVEHKLPPQLQGKAVADGPVPFLFGAKAEQLSRRYWLRIVTPPGTQGEVWLDAYPKFLADAQNFRHVELILAVGQNEVRPSAVQIHHPNGKNRTVYQFESAVVNKTGVRDVFEDPFHARVPAGWQKLVEDAPQAPSPPQRRGFGNAPAVIGDRRTDGPR